MGNDHKQHTLDIIVSLAGLKNEKGYFWLALESSNIFLNRRGFFFRFDGIKDKKLDLYIKIECFSYHFKTDNRYTKTNKK